MRSSGQVSVGLLDFLLGASEDEDEQLPGLIERHPPRLPDHLPQALHPVSPHNNRTLILLRLFVLPRLAGALPVDAFGEEAAR